MKNDEQVLLPQHQRLIDESGISKEVANTRGYWSVINKGEVRRLGFADRQCRVPALVIPVWGVDGKVHRHQVRPDSPRKDGKGKEVKYETPAKSRMALDVHLSIRKKIGNPKIPLFITEGVRKADAAISRGLCCIALLGVWNWRGTNADGGKVALPDWEAIALEGRLIFIAFDSDVMRKAEVQKATMRLKAFLEYRGAKVQLIHLPPGEGGAKNGLDDYLAAGHSVEELLALVQRVPNVEANAEVHARRYSSRQESCRKGPEKKDLPCIIVNGRPFRDVVDESLTALTAQNDPPTLFMRSGQLVSIVSNENECPQIRNVTEDLLRDKLSRSADFVREIQKAQGIAFAHLTPPMDVTRVILSRGEWDIPPLIGIVESPTIRPDGSIIAVLGYDPITKLFYRPSRSLTMPAIPDHPTDVEVRAAVEVLMEPICDFPFRSEADRANALAFMITPIVRPIIQGCVPMALIDSPTAGTGKSLLAKLCSVIATGRPPDMLGPPLEDQEVRKQITAALLVSRNLIVFDNCTHPLGFPNLARALTSDPWSDRLLGQSKDVSIPQLATWASTGNNLKVRGDLPRRVYRIRIDSSQERPWERQSFTHPNLLEWAKENRGRVIAAVLTLARRWFALGEPKPKEKSLGSFESWTERIGGILEAAGIKGFLANQEELYEELDIDKPQWNAFILLWHEQLGEEPITVNQFVLRLPSYPDLIESLPDEISEHWQEEKKRGGFARRLGQALGKREGQIFGGLRLSRAGKDSHTKTCQWRVCGDAGTSGDSFPYLGATQEEDNRSQDELETKEGETVPAEHRIPAMPDTPCPNCGMKDWYYQDCANNGQGGWVCRACRQALKTQDGNKV